MRSTYTTCTCTCNMHMHMPCTCTCTCTCTVCTQHALNVHISTACAANTSMHSTSIWHVHCKQMACKWHANSMCMALRSGSKPSHLALPPGAGPDANFRFVASLSRLSSGVAARPRPRPRPRPTSPRGLAARATPLPRPRPAPEKRDLSATPVHVELQTGHSDCTGLQPECTGLQP